MTMIRPIMTKSFFLKKPSEEASGGDVSIAFDLKDTLEAHRSSCVGMAANMIGERKRIIAVVDEDGSILLMFNPEIVSSSEPYTAEEGCLSLTGLREANRFNKVTVSYQDERLQRHEEQFEGRVAQAIQHEIDHCNGILI